MNMMNSSIIMLTSMFIFSSLSISLIVMMERKIISSTNMRYGPMFPFMASITQSIYDLMKLMTKKMMMFSFVETLYWIMFPCWGLLLALLSLFMMNLKMKIMNFNLMFLMIFLIYSLNIYFYLLSSWSMNSTFSYISAFRVIVQTLSYEVGLIFMMIACLMLLNNYDYFNSFSMKTKFLFFSLFFFLLWNVVFLSETGRIPFDFLEGESELVSGFNIEYSSHLFMIVFFVEYSFILLYAIISSMIFMNNETTFFMFIILFIIIRAAYPRLRFDEMMSLFWKSAIFFFMLIFIFLSLMS